MINQKEVIFELFLIGNKIKLQPIFGGPQFYRFTEEDLFARDGKKTPNLHDSVKLLDIPEAEAKALEATLSEVADQDADSGDLRKMLAELAGVRVNGDYALFTTEQLQSTLAYAGFIDGYTGHIRRYGRQLDNLARVKEKDLMDIANFSVQELILHELSDKATAQKKSPSQMPKEMAEMFLGMNERTRELLYISQYEKGAAYIGREHLADGVGSPKSTSKQAGGGPRIITFPGVQK